MSDSIKHECGLAVVRLLKPLDFYVEKYGTPFWGLNKLHLLMQKMRNRGQDGAGIATIKLNPTPGTRYISRKRSNGDHPIREVFNSVFKEFEGLSQEQLHDVDTLKANYPYAGELMMGHLRYGTHGRNSIESCHPFLRQNNWISRNLVVAGNFNLTNVNELFGQLVDLGQFPKEMSDTVTVLEKIGHFLDDEVSRLHSYHKDETTNHKEINKRIIADMDIERILKRSSKKWDGGYVMGGLIGHGDAFVMRDPNGIRPAYYYQDDEVVAMASERPALQTTFGVHRSTIQELTRGHALIIRANGDITEKEIIAPDVRTGCSFERIYFSRGTDWQIYRERKQLGAQMVDQVLDTLKGDLKNTVFSYVPNTAETAFAGLVEGMNKKLNEIKLERILSSDKKMKREKLEKLMNQTVRVEKLIVKDEKIRTFIADDASRGEMVSHVYDTTYGVVRNEKDTIVILDDSIVRGTTLRDSIIHAVARLKPKKIVVLSSAPQIRYPDCYGIDMSKMANFVAFQALISLLKETGKEKLIDKTYRACLKALEAPASAKTTNHIQTLYNTFTYEQISDRIAKIITPDIVECEVEVIYQTVEGLHEATGPDNDGDWYFTGNFPTPGGNRVANQAFVNYVEKRNERAYV
ncbi:MAG: amidophosphoribosyltransferase [Saprospiraceae bacterium]